MTVSIIVPVYKVEKYIHNCIKSVLAQSYEDWELILVDDGSPDNSGLICDEYAAKDVRIKVTHKENGGQSSARNVALDLPPKGDYITFLDSDDFWHPEYLSIMMKMCVENDADIAQCGFLRGNAMMFPNIDLSSDIKVYDTHSVFVSGAANIIMWAKVYKKSLWNNIRMPIGLYNEDDWTTWKIYYRAKRITITSDKLYYYTLNPTSTMGRLKKKPDLKYFAAYKERIDFFIKEGQVDLEHCSRLQLCKSIVMVYSNPKLDDEQEKVIQKVFSENYKKLKASPYISLKYKVILFLFNISPKLISRIVNKLH